jgi:hypothetical protein
MNPLSKAEAQRWCKTHEIPLNEYGRPKQENDSSEFTIPGDAGARVAMVCRQMEFLRPTGQVFVWFTEWSVWPSGERMHIFERFLASYGEARPLIEKPAFIFEANEYEDLVSFVTIGVLFLWDVHVASASGAGRVFFSHDEYGYSPGGA